MSCALQVLGALVVLSACAAGEAPAQVTYQGRLDDAGQPVNGARPMEFRLFNFASSGAAIATTSFPAVAVADGLFTVELPWTAAFNSLGPDFWLEVAVNGTTLTPRTRVAPAPRAVYSLNTRGITVDASGNVGVGTSVPSGRLHISGEAKIDGVNALEFGFGFVKELNAGKIGYQTFSDGLDIVGAGADSTNRRIRFHSEGGASFSGSLGIGTSNTAERLVVEGGLGLDTYVRINTPGANEARAGLKLRHSSSTYGWTIDSDQRAGSYGLNFLRHSNDAAGVSAMFIDFATGNIGVGTTAPAARFDLVGRGFVRGTGNGQGGGFWFSDPETPATQKSFVGRGSQADAFTGMYSSSSGWALTVNDDGRVGIGTTNPLTKLDVRGGDFVITNAGGQVRVATGISSDRAYVALRSTGGANGLALSAGPEGGRVEIIDGAGVTRGGISFNGAGKLVTESDVVRINGGADIAEPFDVDPSADRVEPQPGMVVSIHPDLPGRLRVSDTSYDRAVAGVISGANGVNPGLMLSQKGSDADGEWPVAMSGRVYVYVDADAGGAVRPGDLLTTSPTPGHAMRVVDYERAAGAAIGKAMSRLDSGRGLVLVLVGAR